MIRMKLEGNNFAEIQKLLKLDSINTVYSQDFRCRKQLVELMGGNFNPGTKDAKARPADGRSREARS